MTLTDGFKARLAEACRGRETYPDHLSINARLGRDEVTRVWWHDAFTGRTAPLGRPLTRGEALEVLPALFTQLRDWRAGAKENRAQAAVSGGGR